MSSHARAILFRRGGLGDFLLTLPLLHALRERYAQLLLVTRRDWWQLIAGEGLADGWLDAEGGAVGSLFAGCLDAALAEQLQSADCFLAWRDPDATLRRSLSAAGARGVYLLEPRPQAPPHQALRLLLDAGLPADAALLDRGWLPRGPAPDAAALWLHPGSGSPAKNAPPAWFAERALDWRDEHGGAIWVSIGEADHQLLPALREALAPLSVSWLIDASICELRDQLARHAGAMVGNDTGVTHLAATLGIPTTAVFRTTDARIWRPLGPAVSLEFQAP